MGKFRSSFLSLNYPQLQNLIKRDPGSYKEEFIQQKNHFDSSLEIFRLKPDAEDDSFCDQVNFIGNVSSFYKSECEGFSNSLILLLDEHHLILNPRVRKTLVQVLILMRNRKLLASLDLLPLFFKLFRCADKQLRELLFIDIVNDIKNANTPSMNNKLNKVLQNFMYEMLKDNSSMAAKKSLQVMVELYRKNIWIDTKTVNVVAEACFSEDHKVSSIALNFFMGHNKEEEESDDEDGTEDLRSMQLSQKVAGKTRSKAAKLKKQKAYIRKKENKAAVEHHHFSALQLIHDPQGFVERMFAKLKKSTEGFDYRILMMNVISRLISTHKIMFFNIYPFLFRYLQPHQKQVTLILAILAQCCHELIPPEEITPLIRKIADQFVSDHCASEVITVGINSIREICSRCPLAMEATLLQDLAIYKTYKDKSVVMAARSLIALYREFNPELLHRKDRGKEASMGMKQFVPPVYGQIISHSIAGIEELESSGHEGDSSKRVRIECEKVLDEEDFAKLAELKGVNAADDSEPENDEFVDVSSIEYQAKKKRATYEERLESIKQGREGRHYGRKLNKTNHGTSNRAKSKKKNFLMMTRKLSVRAKNLAKQKKQGRKRRDY